MQPKYPQKKIITEIFNQEHSENGTFSIWKFNTTFIHTFHHFTISQFHMKTQSIFILLRYFQKDRFHHHRNEFYLTF